MAVMSKEGKRYPSHSSMMAHEEKRSQAGGAGLMERQDPLQNPGAEEQGEMQPHHAAIHEHLQAMHAETGHGHSHVEHHPDGTHTSHHISHEGEISGPHHHASSEEMGEHMKSVMGENEAEPEESEAEPEYE